MKAVIIGSDATTTNFAALALRVRWPDAVPIVAPTAAAGIALVERVVPDLVLLHPDFTDLELTESILQLRQFTSVPLLVLGCQGDQIEVVSALTSGADDYVRLPCNMTELTVRLWAMLRRTGMTINHQNETPFRSGRLFLNLSSHEAFLGEQPIHLTGTEFRLLYTLVKNKGAVVTHRTLENTLWEGDTDGRGLVKKYIQRLRTKLEDNAKSPVWIACIHGIGYRFIGPAPASHDATSPITDEFVPKVLAGVSA